MVGSPYLVKTIIKKTFYQRFFWARLSRYPLIGRIIDHLFFKDDSLFYLTNDKAVKIPVNGTIPSPEDTVLPSQVADYFISKSSHHWIMDSCICRESSGCEDYPVDLGCIFLGEAAMGINPKFGRKASVEETLEHAARCREAGLVHLVGVNKLDSVWLNVRPGKKLLTICNCCPCCCLWKILPEINTDISSKVNRMPGISVTVTDECVGCGACTKDICFVDAIHLKDGRAEIEDTCRGCGRCVTVCPKQAIEIKIDSSSPVSAAIAEIENHVDLT